MGGGGRVKFKHLHIRPDLRSLHGCPLVLFLFLPWQNSHSEVGERPLYCKLVRDGAGLRLAVLRSAEQLEQLKCYSD